MLYREPMWLKCRQHGTSYCDAGVSVLYREPMWLKSQIAHRSLGGFRAVSVLYREPMWLKYSEPGSLSLMIAVSVLYREPMWLKCPARAGVKVVEIAFQCSTVSRCG